MAEKPSQDRRYDKAAARLAAAAAELEHRASSAKARLNMLDQAMRDRDHNRKEVTLLSDKLSRSEELNQAQRDENAALRKRVAIQGKEAGALRVRHAALIREQREAGNRLDTLIDEMSAILNEEE